MKLYHTTSEQFIDDILEQGIKPRGSEPGNWWTNVDGNTELVYLSDQHCTDFYKARMRCRFPDRAAVVIEIDSQFIQENLRIDENLINNEDNDGWPCTFEERYVQRERALTDGRWQYSIEKIGLCTHIGLIPAETFSIHEMTYSSPWLRPEFMDQPHEIDRLVIFDMMINEFNKYSCTHKLTRDEVVDVWQNTNFIGIEEHLETYKRMLPQLQ